jgi:hypothetical protein
MGLGLLGALQGAGQSMTQFGNALFAEETERQRQAELQKIRDTDYKRGRADQLTDQQTVFNREDTLITQRNDREDTVRTGNREYDAGLLREANVREDELLEAANKRADDRYETVKNDDAGLIMNVDVDANGKVYGITKGGTMKDIGDIAVVDPILGNALDAFSAMSRQIQYEQIYRDDNPERFEAIDRLASQITTSLNAASGSMSTEDAVGLGRLLFNGQDQVNDNGTIRSGQELTDARFNFSQQYPGLMELIQGPK